MRRISKFGIGGFAGSAALALAATAVAQAQQAQPAGGTAQQGAAPAVGLGVGLENSPDGMSS